MSALSLVFGLAVIFIGILIFASGSIQIIKFRASRSWPSVMGTVSWSRYNKKVHRSRRGTYYTYPTEVGYHYAVEGTQYSGGQITFGSYEPSREEQAKVFVSRHTPGMEVEVYYNPSLPSESVLVRGNIESRLIAIILGIAIIIFGAVMTVGVWPAISE